MSGDAGRELFCSLGSFIAKKHPAMLGFIIHVGKGLINFVLDRLK